MMKTAVRYSKRVFTPGVQAPLDLIVEVTAPEAEAVNRPPLDVVLVIDRSSSMEGAPIQQVKVAVGQFLRVLGPDDRVAVITFSNDAEVVFPLVTPSIAHAIEAIGRIEADGMTNFSAGWLAALRMLVSSPRQGSIRRIITLTDGHANRGVTGVEELGSMVSGGRGQGVSSSFIGFDDGYDDALLAGLADAGGGDDYWCDGPDKAAAVFLAEFGALASVVSQNVAVTLAPNSGVIDTGLANDLPTYDDEDGRFTVMLGDVYGGETRRVGLRLHLAGHPTEGDVEMAQIQVAWASVEGVPALHNVTVPVVVRWDRDPEAADPDADPEVINEVLVLEAARSQRLAAEAAEVRDFDLAQRLFMRSAVMLEQAGRDADRARQLRSKSVEVGQGNWNQRERKRQYSQSRSATRQRLTNFEDENRDADGEG